MNSLEYELTLFLYRCILHTGNYFILVVHSSGYRFLARGDRSYELEGVPCFVLVDWDSRPHIRCSSPGIVSERKRHILCKIIDILTFFLLAGVGLFTSIDPIRLTGLEVARLCQVTGLESSFPWSPLGSGLSLGVRSSQDL